MEKAARRPSMSRFRVASFFGLLTISAARPAAADTFTETYYFTTGGIAESTAPGNDFKDHSPGPDMLPYTDDDEELPPNGNSGGTWTFGALDTDGDGVPDHMFSCIRRGDDDTYTLTSYSEFQHGVFAEGEDWIDLHEAQNLGPSADGNQGVDLGDDFEWNDRPNWEGQSNWLWYNNAAANQRGLGGSRYYFELRNGAGAFDEVQEWVKMVNLQTNADDPSSLDFNEKSNNYARGDQVSIKGLLIPVDRIPDLKDGELDPLFGWYKGDMAKYVREVLGPKLDDPNLTIFETDEGGNACGRTRSLLPPTFLMIEQGEFQVTIAPGGEAAAAYWGITPITPGEPATGAVLRWCRIMLKGDDDTIEDGWDPPIQLVPEDGSRENLWRREKFVRDGVQEFDPIGVTGTGMPDTWGALQLGCELTGIDDNTPPDHCWFFLRENDSQGFPILEDCQLDHVLTLPGGSGPESSWFALPLTQSLDAAKGKVRAEVKLRVQAGAVANRIQVILTTVHDPDVTPVAWVDLKDGDIARAGVGGRFSASGGGPVTEGIAISPEAPVSLSTTEGAYTAIDLVLDAAAKKLTVKRDGTELLSGTYSGFSDSNVNAVRIWTESGDGDLNQVYVNEVAVLQEFPHPFIRGEANCDGATDISDAVSILGYLFTGGAAPCCLAATDVNADGLQDVSDPVALLAYLFLGGTAPPLPYPACGVDWETSLSCDDFKGCP